MGEGYTSFRLLWFVKVIIPIKKLSVNQEQRGPSGASALRSQAYQIRNEGDFHPTSVDVAARTHTQIRPTL
jgi:hypothetical protein